MAAAHEGVEAIIQPVNGVNTKTLEQPLLQSTRKVYFGSGFP